MDDDDDNDDNDDDDAGCAFRASLWRQRERAPYMGIRQILDDRPQTWSWLLWEDKERKKRRESGHQSVFFVGNGVGWRLPPHSAPEKLNIFRHLPIRGEIFRLGRRSIIGLLSWKLRTIHPNPGPRGRNKSEEGKEARRERRKKRRQEKRHERAQAKVSKVSEVREIVVVTWNVQRMSLVSREKRKAKAVAEYARRSGWDVVLLSEVWAEGEGVVWMGEEEERVAIVYGEKAGVLLRGEILKAWSAEGMRKKISPRHVSVKVKGMMLTATYLPVRVVGREVEAAEEMEVLAEHVRWAKKEELVMVGGDFNAHVGAGSERRGVCGKFGLRTSNQVGREFVAWCVKSNAPPLSSRTPTLS